MAFVKTNSAARPNLNKRAAVKNEDRPPLHKIGSAWNSKYGFNIVVGVEEAEYLIKALEAGIAEQRVTRLYAFFTKNKQNDKSPDLLVNVQEV